MKEIKPPLRIRLASIFCPLLVTKFVNILTEPLFYALFTWGSTNPEQKITSPDNYAFLIGGVSILTFGISYYRFEEIMRAGSYQGIADLLKRFFGWPKIDTVENTERAIKIGFGVAILSIVRNLIGVSIVVLSPTSKTITAGYSPKGILFGSLVTTFLAIGMKTKKSRLCAIILFFALLADIIIKFSTKVPSFWITIDSVLAFYFFNGIRGAFAYHRIIHSHIIMKYLVLKSALAIIYGCVFLLLGSLAMVILGEKIGGIVPSLTLFAIAAALFGWLPFTKNKSVCAI